MHNGIFKQLELNMEEFGEKAILVYHIIKE